MRTSRIAGLVVSSVVCGALAFGSAGGAIAAPVPASVTAPAASGDPLPGADKLTPQVKLLSEMGGVVAPVTRLLDAVIAGGGKLPPEETAKHTKAIDEALKALPKAPGTALEVPAGPTPELPSVVAPRAADAGLELKVKAVADLRTKVDVLLKAAEKGDAAKVKEAVTATITAVLNVVVSIVVGGGLPAPDLAGLPPLPKVPGADAPKAPGSPV
ncbi:hypothetical protein BGM19_20105 [Streptomyces agglomeratus]|uniref:hypothetical protein n=1 Tax=Streptomyces agglomeratus TaxID=285458 RepID=UPI00086C0981|nr:hypothetical protein [Streptomyces agglomeratus]OEJ59946.1 hypothetical protein BGM19_20105 [Streptomyces agglomeratus]